MGGRLATAERVWWALEERERGSVEEATVAHATGERGTAPDTLHGTEGGRVAIRLLL